jgi:predicted peptidase
MLSQARQRGAFLCLSQTANSWSTQTVTDRVMTMIDRAIDDLNADTHRVYISGYSLGAFGTWTMLSRYDGRFAAGIPISGGSTASDFMAAKLVDTPILALHARDDSSAAASATRSDVSGILASAGEPLPTYLSISDPKDFFISNPNLPLHVAFVAQAHQIANVTDFFLSNSTFDMMYYERATGGHSGVLPFMNSPEIYTWLFDHSTVVPEPAACTLLLIGGIVAPTIRRRNYSR